MTALIQACESIRSDRKIDFAPQNAVDQLGGQIDGDVCPAVEVGRVIPQYMAQGPRCRQRPARFGSSGRTGVVQRLQPIVAYPCLCSGLVITECRAM